MRGTLIAAALVASLAGPVAANEYTTYVQLPVAPIGASGDARCTTLALLNLPATWHPGDAIVVMLTAGPGHNAQRDPLIAAFLDEQAGVLEVSPDLPAACAEGRAEATPLAPRHDPLDLVFGSLLAARQQAGGGLVVAIGHGQSGSLALAAVNEAEASARLGPDGPRFAAALAIGDERTRFRLGAAQAEVERTELRLGLLCEVLARSGATHGEANGQACSVDVEAGAISVRTALQR